MRRIAAIGELRPDARLPGDWVSQPVPVPFWAGLPLPFVVTAEAMEEGDPGDAGDAIAAFLSLGEHDRRAAAPRVYRNYLEFVALTTCPPLDVAAATDIWRYVRPTAVMVERRGQDGLVYVALCCECDWEVEHGVQLVFERGGRLVRVSEQDGHLTHEDAGSPPEPEGD